MKAIYCPAGRMEVGIAGRFDDVAVVRVEMPDTVELTPDSARSLAVALIEHAADVERRNRKDRK